MPMAMAMNMKKYFVSIPVNFGYWAQQSEHA